MHTTLLSLVRRNGFSVDVESVPECRVHVLNEQDAPPLGIDGHRTRTCIMLNVGSSEWSGTRPRAEYNFRTSDSTSLEVQRVQLAPRCLELGVLTPAGRTESLVESSNDGTFTTDVCDDTSGWPCFVDDGSPQRRTVFFSLGYRRWCNKKTRVGQNGVLLMCGVR